MAEKKPIIVDTDIFIKVFRGDSIRKKHLDVLKGRINISIITILELYQGAKTRQRKHDLEKQLKAYHVLMIDLNISQVALTLVKKYLPKNLLLPPDCLIAATALQYNYELYTDNKTDFNFIKGLKLYKP